MDVHFNSTIPSTRQETILATVRYEPSGSGPNGMQLLSFERTSKYNVFNSCNDEAKSIQLCICESGRKYELNNATGIVSYVRQSQQVSRTRGYRFDNCLHLIQYDVEGGVGASVYVANVCPQPRDYAISLASDENVRHSFLPTHGVQLLPYDVQFLLVLQFLSTEHVPVEKLLVIKLAAS